VAQRLGAEDEALCREVRDKLLPVVGLFDLAARVKDLEGTLEVLRSNELLGDLTIARRRRDLARWAEASYLAARARGALQDIEFLLKRNQRLSLGALSEELRAVIDRGREVEPRLEEACALDPEEADDSYWAFSEYWVGAARATPNAFVDASLEYELNVLTLGQKAWAAHRYTRIRRVLERSLNYWGPHVEELNDAPDSERSELQDLDDVWEFLSDDPLWVVLGKDLFQPELWVARGRELSRVRLNRLDGLNQEGRQLLMEIYQSFIFGHWLSVAALSRALVEKVIKIRASALGISLTWPNQMTRANRPSEKRLKDLIEDVSEEVPDLHEGLVTVQEAGNQALHAKSKRSGPSVAHEAGRLQEEALEIVRVTQKVVERLLTLGRK
jgi:hypothetical protein